MPNGACTYFSLLFSIITKSHKIKRPKELYFLQLYQFRLNIQEIKIIQVILLLKHEEKVKEDIAMQID